MIKPNLEQTFVIQNSDVNLYLPDHFSADDTKGFSVQTSRVLDTPFDNSIGLDCNVVPPLSLRTQKIQLAKKKIFMIPKLLLSL